MDDARRIADQLCGDGRILMHGQALPALGNLDAQLDAMNALVGCSIRSRAWKVYTHAPSPWFLDDHDPSSRRSASAFLDRVRETGREDRVGAQGLRRRQPVRGARRHRPRGVGASRHPLRRVPLRLRGRRTPKVRTTDDGRGVDRLVRTLQDAGVAAGANVYAELGSTWFNVMRDPDQAAHVLGKLLVAVGPDNVALGHRLDLVRVAPGPDRGVPHVRDHPGVPGAVRLPRAHPRAEAQDPRRERRGALRRAADHRRAASSRPTSSSRHAPRCPARPASYGPRDRQRGLRATWPTTAGSASREDARALLVRLGRDAQVGLHRVPALRELVLRILVGDRRRR